MATGRITKQAVDAAPSGFLWDDVLKGFGLRVTPAGARSYVFQYRLGGREASARRVTIGTHGSPWTPATARDEARRLSLLVGQGIDPAVADQERRRQSVDLAFDRYVDLFHQRYLSSEWKRGGAAHSMLKRDAVPVLGRRALPTLRRSDFTELWDRLSDRPATARLMHATLGRMFTWAIERGDLDHSPLAGAAAPRPVKSRDRVLSDWELASAWRGAETIGEPFCNLFRLLILTGQRREEVASLKWGELDRARSLWVLPAERAKNDQQHLVPLSGLALQVLDGVAGSAKWPTAGFVFTTNGRTAVSGFSRAKERLDMSMAEDEAEQAHQARRSSRPIEEWRVHDLRRTLATGMQRLDVRFEVVEAILNHVSGSRSGVSGVYQRHAWVEEKRAALDEWSSFLVELVA